ncbi:MAG: hypothetical protein WC833_08725 [Bacteroidales bacterium]|jgi:hypothetical protein
MSKAEIQKRIQVRQARLEIAADLYKKGHSIRSIKGEVMKRLGLETLSTKTVHSDIQYLLVEWKKSRIEDTDLAVQLELTRIDDTIKELWEQWEKSKTDYKVTAEKKKGGPSKKDPVKGIAKIGFGVAPAESEQAQPNDTIKTYSIEKSTKNVTALGDVSYIAEIRQQLIERRKLLGLYAPEKTELTGKNGRDLMSSGVKINLDDYTEDELQQILALARKIGQNN